jgi:hypothetical protein
MISQITTPWTMQYRLYLSIEFDEHIRWVNYNLFAAPRRPSYFIEKSVISEQTYDEKRRLANKEYRQNGNCNINRGDVSAF